MGALGGDQQQRKKYDIITMTQTLLLTFWANLLVCRAQGIQSIF
jgi:hypothetical protein